MKAMACWVVMVIGFVLGATTASAQSAREAVMGLKQLEARCQTGISYRDYSGALADAKFPVNVYVESDEASNHSEFVASLNSAMQHYEFANRLWNAKFTAEERDIYLSGGFFSEKSSWAALIKENYPAVPLIEKFYPLDAALPVIWGEASAEIKNASKLLSEMSTDTTGDIERLKMENDKLKADMELEKLKRENEELKRQLELKKSGGG